MLTLQASNSDLNLSLNENKGQKFQSKSYRKKIFTRDINETNFTLESADIDGNLKNAKTENFPENKEKCIVNMLPRPKMINVSLTKESSNMGKHFLKPTSISMINVTSNSGLPLLQPISFPVSISDHKCEKATKQQLRSVLPKTDKSPNSNDQSNSHISSPIFSSNTLINSSEYTAKLCAQNVSTMNPLLATALVNCTTANLIAQLANSVSATMLTLVQTSLNNEKTDATETMLEIDQLLSTIKSLTTTLSESLPAFTKMYSSLLSPNAALLASVMSTNRYITINVIPSTTLSQPISVPSSFNNTEPGSIKSVCNSILNNSNVHDSEYRAPVSVISDPAGCINRSQIVNSNHDPKTHSKNGCNCDIMSCNDRSHNVEMKSIVSTYDNKYSASSSDKIPIRAEPQSKVEDCESSLSRRNFSTLISESSRKSVVSDAVITSIAASSSSNSKPISYVSSSVVEKLTPVSSSLMDFAESKIRGNICGQIEKRPHVCVLCSAKFARLYNLRRHLRTHSKELPQDELIDISKITGIQLDQLPQMKSLESSH